MIYGGHDLAKKNSKSTMSSFQLILCKQRSAKRRRKVCSTLKHVIKEMMVIRLD